jgi:hypothetical protein
MTVTEVYESVTNGGSSDFAALVKVLNRNAPWCLIGGLAVNCYVEPVFTVDADVVVVAEKLDTITHGLSAEGFSLRKFPHSVNAKRGNSELRIQITTDSRYQDFLKETETRKVLGEEVPVASLVNVVRGKIWAWSDKSRRPTKRKKDELDLMRILEAYPELEPVMPEEITRQLRNP